MKNLILIILCITSLSLHAKEYSSEMKMVAGIVEMIRYSFEKSLNKNYSLGASYSNLTKKYNNYTEYKLHHRYSILSKYQPNGIFKDGWLYELDLSYTHMKYNAKPYVNESGHKSGLSLNVSAGYRWQFSTFFIRVAGDFALYTYDPFFTVKDSSRRLATQMPGDYTLALTYAFGFIF